MNEDNVAFHDIVTLLGWRDSSSTGAKVMIGLPSRAALEHFDTATRRRGKRAGQRYHAAMYPPELDPKENSLPEPLGLLELWFAGANWAHQDGARVAFTVDQDGLEFFKTLTTQDSRHGTPSVFWLTLVQVGEDEAPVNQRQADVIESVVEPGRIMSEAAADAAIDILKTTPPIVEPDRPKGGPHSKRAAMLCQEAEFQWYVSEQEDRDEKSTVEQCDAYLKKVCGITSKVELDHSNSAHVLFQTLMRQYIRWGGAESQEG